MSKRPVRIEFQHNGSVVEISAHKRSGHNDVFINGEYKVSTSIKWDPLMADASQMAKKLIR